MLIRRAVKNIEVPLPIRIDRFTEILRIRGVPVLVHWSVLIIAILILVNVIHHPLASVLGLMAYMSVLLIHETGHLIAAEKMHCDVHWIRLYPLWGVTSFEVPWSKFDHCIIAWGGVIAQAIVGIPIAIAISIFGYTRFEFVNAVLVILGFFSLGEAAFNLLPAAPLDGAIAWSIVPEAFKRYRSRGRPSRPYR